MFGIGATSPFEGGTSGIDEQSFVEEEAIGVDSASIPEYIPTTFSFGGASSHWHRSSDPHPIPGTSGGYYAASEPLPEPSGNASKYFHDRTYREHERCEKKLKKCQLQRKEAEKLAESRGIRLFYSLKEAKEYKDAKILYSEIMNDRNPIENEVFLDLSHSFAAMLIEEKKFQDAEPISRIVWEKRKGDPGPPSEIFKESHRQLCSILCAVGKHKDAENMQRNMYQSGTMDAWTLENGDEVCQRLREQGDIGKAKNLQDEVWKERKNQNGARDDLTVRSGLRLIGDLEQLVATMENQDGNDAERKRNISRKETFGYDIEVTLLEIWDPKLQSELTTDILDAGHKLGDVIFRQDRFKDAEAIFIPVLESKKRIVGDGHASTMSTARMLVRTLCRQEEPETYRRAVDILLDMWPSMMRNVDAEAISNCEDLAQAYRSLGDWPNAEHIYGLIERHKISKRYPSLEIENTRWLLGQTLYNQGASKMREAQIILSRLYQQWNASLPDHDKTLNCGYMLARLLSTQDGRVEEALKVALDVFNGRRASMDKGVAYLDSGYLYASLLEKKGMLAAAEDILQAVWEYEAAGPEEQTVRLKCGHLLAQNLAKGHKYPNAIKILEAVAEAQTADPARIHELAKTRQLLEDVNRQKRAKDKIKRTSRRGSLFLQRR